MNGLVQVKNDTTGIEYRGFDFHEAGINIFGDKYHDKSGFSNCIVCARDTSKKGKSSGVIIVAGGGIAVHIEDAEIAKDAGYMGWFPIGSECIKKVPSEFRIENWGV